MRLWVIVILFTCVSAEYLKKDCRARHKPKTSKKKTMLGNHVGVPTNGDRSCQPIAKHLGNTSKEI